MKAQQIITAAIRAATVAEAKCAALGFGASASPQDLAFYAIRAATNVDEEQAKQLAAAIMALTTDDPSDDEAEMLEAAAQELGLA